MKTLLNGTGTHRVLSLLLVSLALFCLSCKPEKKTSTDSAEMEKVVEVITGNMDFQMADTINSGWNTFRYKNLSPQTHFILVDKYPSGKLPRMQKK